MYKNLPSKLKDIKGNVALAELQRTHMIVFILSIISAFLLFVISYLLPGLVGTLCVFAILLLLVLGAMSLTTAIAISRLIKK